MKHARPQARKLKKQTRDQERKAEARQRAKMFTVAAILFSQAESTKRLNKLTNPEKEQVARIEKWALAAIDVLHKEQPLGVKLIREGYKRADIVDRTIEITMPSNSITLEEYAARWIAFSLLADDTRTELGGKSKEWNYLAGCVATWTDKVLTQSGNPKRAESLGGELGEKAWEIILK